MARDGRCRHGGSQDERQNDPLFTMRQRPSSEYFSSQAAMSDEAIRLGDGLTLQVIGLLLPGWFDGTVTALKLTLEAL